MSADAPTLQIPSLVNVRLASRGLRRTVPIPAVPSGTTVTIYTPDSGKVFVVWHWLLSNHSAGAYLGSFWSAANEVARNLNVGANSMLPCPPHMDEDFVGRAADEALRISQDATTSADIGGYVVVSSEDFIRR